MDNASTKIKLGKVLTRRKDEIDVQELESYKRLTIRMNGQGIEVRDCILGSQIGTKRQFIVESGQLVLSKIDARNGAFGILPDACDKAIITGNFWAFDIDHAVLESRYFDYLTKTPLFVDFCIRASDGTTNRLYLQESKFLNMEISLPLIAEQRRIVARIEELAAKIEEARGLREGAIKESDALEKALLDEVYKSNLENFGSVKLSEVCLTITDGDHFTPSFQGTGVKFIFVGNVSSGSLHFQGCKYVSPEYYAAIKSHRKPENGDILYSAVGATLGIPAIVDSDEEFCFQRHVALLKPDRSQLIPKFLWHILRSRSLYRAAWERTTGSAQPTVPLRSIRSLQVPKPPLDEQKSIVLQLDDLQSKADAIKQLREDSLKEFDALLPAILDKAFKGEL
jgi:type I restriction enzyme, S subunit